MNELNKFQGIEIGSMAGMVAQGWEIVNGGQTLSKAYKYPRYSILVWIKVTEDKIAYVTAMKNTYPADTIPEIIHKAMKKDIAISLRYHHRLNFHIQRTRPLVADCNGE